ncbi:SHOCT domain-containing protein, partial [Nonomuraea angiospora]
ETTCNPGSNMGTPILVCTKTWQQVNPVSAASPAFPPSERSAAQRLEELEALRTAGAITDDEYAAKRRQIISEI